MPCHLLLTFLGVFEKMVDVIHSYFFGIPYNHGRLSNHIELIGYAVPDFGIVYRGRSMGTAIELSFEGLMALLKLIAGNRKALS